MLILPAPVLVVIRAVFFIYLLLNQCTAWLYRSSTTKYRYSYYRSGVVTEKIHPLSAAALQPTILQSEPSSFNLEQQFDRNENTVQLALSGTSGSDSNKYNANSSNSSINNTTNRQQLWLDLRDTALFPKEAIRFIHDQCCCHNDDMTTRKHLIDAVLVSSSNFRRIIASSVSETHENADDEWYHPYKLYYTTHDTTTTTTTTTLEQLVLHEPTAQQSIVVGTVVCCSEKDKTDLDIVSLSEQIIKQHQWVLVLQQDTTTSTNKTPVATTTTNTPVSKHMMKQLNEFIQFVSSSSNRKIMLQMDNNNNNYKVTASGLFLAPAINNTNYIQSMTESISSQQITSNHMENMSHVDDDSSSNGIANGGIAIVCSDRTSFVLIDAMLAEFRQLESIGTTTTTLSGITIPSNTSIVPQQQSPFVTALVLPLDVSIWETVYNNNARYMEGDNTQ